MPAGPTAPCATPSRCSISFYPSAVEKLTAEQVHHLLGTADEERIAGLAGAVLDKNPARALEIIGQAADQGLQLGELLDQVIEYWRDLMVVQCTGDEKQILSMTGPHCQALKEQAGRAQAGHGAGGVGYSGHRSNPVANASHGRVIVEMALVRLSRLEDLVSLVQLAQWAASREGAAVTPSAAAVRHAPSVVPHCRNLCLARAG